MHGKPDDLPQPKDFGDVITADHAIISEDHASRSGCRTALVIQDRATQWIQAYAAVQHTKEETMCAFQRFLGPGIAPKHVYTDGSGEFNSAMKLLGFSHDTSTPHRPQTNGVAERAVRRVKEGASCCIVQAGLAAQWWPEAMQCYCFLRNIIDLLSDGHTAYHRRWRA